MVVAPLRNLTGDPEQQTLVEGFSEGVLANLCRHCRGFTFVSTAGDRDLTAKLASLNPLEPKYVVSGSVQRGSRHGMLRANIRVSDAVTGNYLWAGREEFWVEHLEPIQTELVRRISRVLHILFLHDVSYRASMTSDAELGVTECLARAVNALKGKLCAEFSAEAQQWFLAALACDPRNVEALVGVALTCQHLASNPWWGDPLGAAAASDLGREAVAVALELQPGHALAHCVQGMLYSAVGELEQADAAFRLALAIDPGLGSAHAFLGYNRALLCNAEETLPAIERAMRLDPTDRHHSIWLFFGGFAELLVDRSGDCLIPEIAGTQSHLWKRRAFFDSRPFPHWTAPGRGLDCRVVPPAILRIPGRRLRTALAIPVGFAGLSHPGLPIVRENTDAQCGCLTRTLPCFDGKPLR